MRSINEVVDELVALEVGGMSDAELSDGAGEVSRAIEVMQALFLRMTAELDRRRPFEADGILSTSRFLATTCDMADSTAREKVRVARALESMPDTARRFHSGELTYSKVRMLAAAAEAHPDMFAEHEAALVDVASNLTVKDTRRAIDYWKQNLEGPLSFAEMVERSHVHLSQTWQGMVAGDFLLDPEAGAIVAKAIESAMPPPDARASGEDLPRMASQRRADALTHICRRHLDNGDKNVGGERPHVTVLVDLETLELRTGRTCELDRFGTIPAETARRLACDARVSRIIVGPDSQPLDVGRTARTFTGAQRRAITVRDRHCAFPGCDRPPQWCDVHHVIHWIDGGETCVANGALLCRRHHVLHHEGGFGIEGQDGCLTFTRPDDSVIAKVEPPRSVRCFDHTPGPGDPQ